MSADTAFRFVQLELPWSPGPEPGRYLVREHLGEPPGHVIVVALLSAPERRRPRRRARTEGSSPDPRPVPIWRVTIIDARALEPRAAADWLRRGDHTRVVNDALTRLGRVLRLHRIAAADANVGDLTADQALVVRVGFGSGEQVADATWDAAVTLPPPGSSRRSSAAALRPQERFAALLGGRDAPLACEELTLRARSDLNAGREREAALQLEVALRTALAELAPWRDSGDLADRLTELAGLSSGVTAAATRALQGGLDRHHAEDVAHALRRIEAALRARTVEALG